MSKLPASFINTIGTLYDDPTAVADPYGELQRILLRSYAYGLSPAQKTARLLDRSGLGSNKPSVQIGPAHRPEPGLAGQRHTGPVFPENARIHPERGQPERLQEPEAKSKVPCRGDKVDSGIGLRLTLQ